MSRGPSSFKKRDLQVAIEAAVAAGLGVRKVRVDKLGNIEIETGKPGESPPETDDNDDPKEIIL